MKILIWRICIICFCICLWCFFFCSPSLIWSSSVEKYLHILNFTYYFFITNIHGLWYVIRTGLYFYFYFFFFIFILIFIVFLYLGLNIILLNYKSIYNLSSWNHSTFSTKWFIEMKFKLGTLLKQFPFQNIEKKKLWAIAIIFKKPLTIL